MMPAERFLTALYEGQTGILEASNGMNADLDLTLAAVALHGWRAELGDRQPRKEAIEA
jgi:hypothetical protein